MKGEWRDYLIDILESALEVEVFIAGMSYDDLFRDKKTINAGIRSLEVMGRRQSEFPKEFVQIILKFPGNGWRACVTN